MLILLRITLYFNLDIMSLFIQQLAYYHADKELLFKDISFSINNHQKVSLIGNNGSGKSTLLQLINGDLIPTEGTISYPEHPYYIPQHFGQYNHLTIAEALKIDKKIKALDAITKGDVSTENFNILNDEWEIEEKAHTALEEWGIGSFDLTKPLSTLSGGEKTKVFLAGISIHSPSIILMDEPTNHLDIQSRNRLYDFIETTHTALLVVSHDRTLLNLLPYTYELSKSGVTAYGGNYEFYKNEKEKLTNALYTKLEEKEKGLRAAKKIAKETAERKQKLDARGEKRSIKQGVARIMMNNLKNKAEKSTSKIKDTHEEKQMKISQELTEIRKSLPDISQMKINFNSSSLHKGKILVKAHNINFAYSSENLWKDSISFEVKSGERISIEGRNGKGKTTLLKMILGELLPAEGDILRADVSYIHIDQEYSIINNDLTVVEQAQQFNDRALKEHEINMILNRYLFPPHSWNKACNKLSGGEKMRLVLCCLMISNSTPDLFIMDEPTNNIDIRNVEILTETLRDYEGTVLVISHDNYFKKEINIERQICLQ